MIAFSLLDNMADRENYSKFYQKFVRSILYVRAVTNLQNQVALGRTAAILNFRRIRTHGCRFQNNRR